MQDEAEEPTIENDRHRPTRGEFLLVAAAWAMLAVTLVAGLRIWAGGSH